MANLPSQFCNRHSLLQKHSRSKESVMLGSVDGSDCCGGQAPLQVWESQLWLEANSEIAVKLLKSTNPN